MSVLHILLGGILGLLYGSLIAYVNSKLTENYIRKNKEQDNPLQRVNSFSFTRQLVNAAALVILFLCYGILKKMFVPVLVGTLVGIGLVSYLFLLRIGRKSQEQDEGSD